MFWGNHEALVEARKAYDEARTARAAMDGHERLCMERWNEARAMMQKIEAMVSSGAAIERRRSESNTKLVFDTGRVIIIGLLGIVISMLGFYGHKIGLL